MWKKIKVWRKQLLCVGTGMFLGAAAWILQERDPVIKEGNVLERPAADESYPVSYTHLTLPTKLEV